jgi:tRNA threonylcarbamoyladenosine biosynthesis protein TsaE
MILDEEKLCAFGMDLAEGLAPGALIALTGGLGTGKTTLTKAIARGLGVTDTVASPTFTLINEYGGGRLPLYHFDVYRLAGPGVPDIYEALEQLGWEDYFYGGGVCVVEWADLIRDVLPGDAVRIRLSHLPSHPSEAGSPGLREVTIL